MAFKTDPLATAYAEVQKLAQQVKAFAVSITAQMAADDVDAYTILSVRSRCIRVRDRFNVLKDQPGIVDYAKEQHDDPAYDVATEFVAMLAALDAIVANIEATLPQDGSGYLLVLEYSSVDVSPRAFTPAMTATLRGLLTTLAGTIE